MNAIVDAAAKLHVALLLLAKESPESVRKRTGRCPDGYYWDGEDTCLVKENESDPDEKHKGFSRKAVKRRQKDVGNAYLASEKRKKPSPDAVAKQQRGDALKRGLDRAKARYAHRQSMQRG